MRLLVMGLIVLAVIAVLGPFYGGLVGCVLFGMEALRESPRDDEGRQESVR